MFFDFCFLIEDIAKAFMEAEEKLKSWFNWNMVKELDEETFIRYMEEWEGGKLDEVVKEDLLESFRKWEYEMIWFSEFWEKFNRNRVEVNWLKLIIQWNYVYKDGKYVLSNEIESLYPKKYKDDRNK